MQLLGSFSLMIYNFDILDIYPQFISKLDQVYPQIYETVVLRG